MKILVELNSPEELLRFFETMDPTKAATPDPAPAASKQQPEPQQAETQAPAASKQQSEPAPAQTFKAVTFEEVTQAAIKKMDAGKQTELRALLQKYGVQALPELKTQPEKLNTFYADLEVL